MRASVVVVSSSLLGLFAVGCLSDDSSAPPPGTDAGFVPFDAGPGFDAGARDATTPVDATADAGTDSATDAGNDTSTDDVAVDAPIDVGVDAAPAPGVYVDPVTGDDANDGTQAHPFKTIAKAGNVLSLPDAGAGQTVYLADGTYDASTQTNLSVSFANVTFVRGSAPGKVVIVGSGKNENLFFQKGGSVTNVSFKDTDYGVQSLGGTFALSGVTFDGAGKLGFPMAFTNDTVATVDATGAAPFLANLPTSSFNASCMYVDNTAVVTWKAAGAITSASGANCVFARGGAQVAIDGMQMKTFNGYLGVLYDQAKLTLTNSTIDGAGPANGTSGAGSKAALWLGGSQTGAPTASLTLSGTTITNSSGSAVGYTLTTNTAQVALSFTNSHLDGNPYSGIWVSGGINVALAITVDATSSTFDGNGIAGISSPQAKVTLTKGSVSNNGNGAAVGALGQTPGGVLLTDAKMSNAIVARGVTFASNNGDTLNLVGSNTAKLDLGTQATAGGSTFSGIGAKLTAVHLQAPIAGTADGNVWMPSTQGADATGHYTKTTIVGPASGVNATVISGASLELAP